MRLHTLVTLVFFLICTGCQKIIDAGGEKKDLPPFCMGLMSEDQTGDRYPFKFNENDTIADSLYSIGFYFYFQLCDSFCENWITHYYGKAIVIEEHSNLWSTMEVVYEEEVSGLFNHHFRKILRGYYNDSYRSDESSTFYIQYYFEIECLYKYNRELPPFIPKDHHFTQVMFTII